MGPDRVPATWANHRSGNRDGGIHANGLEAKLVAFFGTRSLHVGGIFGAGFRVVACLLESVDWFSQIMYIEKITTTKGW